MHTCMYVFSRFYEKVTNHSTAFIERPSLTIANAQT